MVEIKMFTRDLPLMMSPLILTYLCWKKLFQEFLEKITPSMVRFLSLDLLA